MSKVFVIPDIHLKPWILKKAEELLCQEEYDKIVFLGDLVDDWKQQENLQLYQKTIEDAVLFAENHQNMLYCYGNHDVSYLWRLFETGYSESAREIVVKGIESLKSALPAGNMAYIHRVDDVLFSHAGLTNLFIQHFFPNGSPDIDRLLLQVNSSGQKEMWSDVSPIWARPQDGYLSLYAPGMMQVVGHTPVAVPHECGGLLTLDTFSTYSSGLPIGDQRFVWVDTEKKKWYYADKRDTYDQDTLTSVIDRMRRKIAEKDAWRTPEEYQRIIDDYRQEKRGKQNNTN